VKGLCILGSTGSIGLSTLDVAARRTDRYRIVALTAHRDVESMAAQCQRYRPDFAVMADASAAQRLRERLAGDATAPEVLGGVDALAQVAALESVEVVMAAIVGAAGLLPILAAARAGKRILLANKEALVVAGALLLSEVEKNGAQLLPIDSEHNAIFQCLPMDFQGDLAAAGVERILLTASGGPFLDWPLDQLSRVTPDQACAHPNWEMGRKISVDSATMMNKGLELIEACWLFSAKPEQIQILIHPQSIVHSLVQYQDGSVLAELGNPDMRTPIAHALAWPRRIHSGVSPLDLFSTDPLAFRPVERDRFPCLDLAYQAAKIGGAAPAVLNAANEVAVAAFLAEQIRFTEIPVLVNRTLEKLGSAEIAEDDLEALLAIDQQARRFAKHLAAKQV